MNALRSAAGLCGIALLTLAGCASQQTVPQSERTIHYTVETGMSADEAYEVSEEWLATSFVSSQDVIQLRDRDDQRIIGRGSAAVVYTYAPVTTRFLITLEHRDGRARMTIDQIEIVQEIISGPIYNRGQFNAFRRDVAKPMHSDWQSAFTESGGAEW